ncbi:MAG TPA: response regulator, partial [Coleofasciculaceae cyanobacterium]
MNNNSNSTLRENILVVDDNPANLNLLNEILSRKGYKVRAAISGQMVLKTVQLTPPDLILLDILMPEMDGYEVCQVLKSTPTTQDIPIIFISALNEVVDKVKAFEMGGVDYISKPFQAEEVLVRVENQLRIRRLSTQLLEQNTRLQEELLERQRVEQALRESQLLLKGIIEGSTDQIAALDLEFRYIAFNSSYRAEFLKIFNRDIEIGSNLMEVLADQLEEQVKLVNLWRRALAGEEFTLIQEFGEANRERNYYEITYSSIRDSTGRQIGASHIIKNVSDRIQAEQEREQLLLQIEYERARFEAVLRQMPAAIWIMEAPSGKVILHNDKVESVLGHPPSSSEKVNDVSLYSAIHADRSRYALEEYPIVRSLLTGEIVINEEML